MISKSTLRLLPTICVIFIATIAKNDVEAFAPSTMIPIQSSSSLLSKNGPTSQLSMIDNSLLDIVSSTSTSSMMLSETEAWVQPLANVLGPFLNIFSFAMLCRVVISWYPSANLNEPPYNIVAWPTEPLLRLIRGSVPPAFGVDITPIVWLAIFTFFNEILLGQQGLLTMKIKYGI